MSGGGATRALSTPALSPRMPGASQARVPASTSKEVLAISDLRGWMLGLGKGTLTAMYMYMPLVYSRQYIHTAHLSILPPSDPSLTMR